MSHVDVMVVIEQWNKFIRIVVTSPVAVSNQRRVNVFSYLAIFRLTNQTYVSLGTRQGAEAGIFYLTYLFILHSDYITYKYVSGNRYFYVFIAVGNGLLRSDYIINDRNKIY